MAPSSLRINNLNLLHKIILSFIFIAWLFAQNIAFANIYTIEADGFYIVNDGPQENINIAQERAFMEAKRAATEKAGVFVESISNVKNGELIKDEINTISSQILKITSKDITTESSNGFTRYKCHISAIVDSSNITNQLLQDRQKMYEAIEQYKKKEQELAAIKDELLELKTKYKTASNNEKTKLTLQLKENENRFEAMSFVDKGNSFYYQENYNEAIRLYNLAIEKNSSLALAWNNLGFSYCKAGNFSKAIEHLHIAAKLQPDNSAIWNNLGYTYAEMGNYTKAIEYCRKATIELNSDWSPAWNNLGAAYGYTEDYQAEIIYCTKATQLDSTNTYAWNNLGAAYNGIRDYKKAIECLHKAIKLDNQSSTIWYNLGYAYAETNHLHDAITCFSKAHELQPQNKKYMDAYICAKKMSLNNKGKQ